MLDFWIELPWWLRLTIAGIVLTLGILICLFVNIRVGFVLTGLGIAMLLVGGRSESEKQGYRF